MYLFMLLFSVVSALQVQVVERETMGEWVKFTGNVLNIYKRQAKIKRGSVNIWVLAADLTCKCPKGQYMKHLYIIVYLSIYSILYLIYYSYFSFYFLFINLFLLIIFFIIIFVFLLSMFLILLYFRFYLYVVMYFLLLKNL